MKWLALAIVAAAAPAAADPCDVRIKHAPDDVRAVVTQWLLDEPECGAALEVRIVPTDGGLYVFARDANGRVRERTVPDAQSAGVLIASWAAADASVSKPAMDVTLSYVPSQPTMNVELSYVRAPPAAVEAFNTPGTQRDVGVNRSLASRARGEKTFALHVFGNQNTFGMRGEHDVWRRGPWVAAAVMSLAHDDHVDFENRGFDELEYADFKTLASIALVGRQGPWRVQWSAAGGLVTTYVKGRSFLYGLQEAYGDLSALGVSPTFESALTVGLKIAPQVYLDAGPLASVLVQRYYVETTMGHTEIEPRGFELMFFGGMRYMR